MVVVGAGNAALCAAISARESGAAVTVLERAPKSLRGGNSAFTAGAMRVAYSGLDDIRKLVPDLTGADAAQTNFGSYTKTDFYLDLARVTEYRADPELASLLTERSFDTLVWMRDHGVRFAPMYGRQAYDVDGQFTFWGGLVVEIVGGGVGLVDALAAHAEQAGIRILYDHRAVSLHYEDDVLRGVKVRTPAGTSMVLGDAVVLAAGGFQANAEWRTRYLGPGWDLAKVRGTRFNTGDGIRMALDAGAAPVRALVGLSRGRVGPATRPSSATCAVGDGFQKHSYPFGIVVNADGKRFLDEGADFRNYTYAKYGRVILEQPGQFAWQVFDAKVTHLLRDEYRIRQVTKVQARQPRGTGRASSRASTPAASSTRSRRTTRPSPTDVAVQPERQGRTGDRRPRRAQEQLGEHHRRAAVRGLRGDLRDHVHLRRPAHRPATPPSSTRGQRRSPGCSRAARWSAGSSTSTTPAAPASPMGRYSAGSPASPLEPAIAEVIP